MATAGNKTRIYDLAKELKLDNKKVIEDARREGIDVSVPSNTVPNEVAERIRAKYFPKKATPRVAPRLIKHAHMETSAPALAEDDGYEPIEAPLVEAPPSAGLPAEPSRTEPRGPQIRVLKKAPAPAPVAPPVQAASPVAEAFTPVEPSPVTAPPTPVETVEPPAPVVEPAPPIAAAPPIPEPAAPPVAPPARPVAPPAPRVGQQVRQLRRI